MSPCIHVMDTLQHHALFAYAKTHAYTGDAPVIENIILEIDQLRNNLEDELVLLVIELRNLGNKDRLPNMEEYADIAREIERILFDEFTYEGVVTTEAHVHWKEYFHSLHEFVVIDPGEPEMLAGVTAYYDAIPRPKPLEPTDPCFPMVYDLLELFETLKELHDKGIVNIATRHNTMVENGLKKLTNIKRQREVKAKLELYNAIIEWSLRP